MLSQSFEDKKKVKEEQNGALDFIVEQNRQYLSPPVCGFRLSALWLVRPTAFGLRSGLTHDNAR